MKFRNLLALFLVSFFGLQVAGAQQQNGGAPQDPFDPFAPPQVQVPVNPVQPPVGDKRSILKVRLEIYSVKKEDFVDDRAKLQELVKAGKAKLISGGETQSHSGQRTSFKSLKEVIYASAGDSSGIEFETRNVGTLVELDGVFGADGYTVDLNYSISHVTAAPEFEWRLIPVGGGLNVEDPKFATKELRSSSTFWASDKYKLLGIMPEVTSETAQAQELVYPVFIQVQKATEL